MKLSLFLIVTSLACISCAPKNEVQNSRAAVIPDLSKAALSSAQLTPLASAIAEQQNNNACDRLDILNGQVRRNDDTFTYLGVLRAEEKNGTRQVFGKISLNESPLIKFIIGESFQVDDEEAFFEKVKQAHENGEVSGMKFFMVKFMKFLGMLGSVKYSVTNEKLNDNFPGLFAKESPVEKSLHWQIANKVSKLEDLPFDTTASILTKRVPLFPSSGSWQAWAEESRLNLAAAIASLNKNSDRSNARERLCALVLLHHNFAQLLSLKGYQAPTMEWDGESSYVLRELSASQPSFPKEATKGGFFDLDTSSTIVLNNDGIQKYDPREKYLALSARLPNIPRQNESGTLSDSLAAMQALLFAYEASSPASPWAEDKYLFGDITKANNAILPAEAYALALGLLSVEFKNLAALYIMKVNAQGQTLRAGEAAAGIALVSDSYHGFTITKLDDVLRLTEITIYLSNALTHLANKNIDWAAKNPIYTPTTLAALLGKAKYSDSELDSILSKDAQANVLLDNLKTLKLPLALLIYKMTDLQNCISELDWDLASGLRKPRAICTGEQKAKVAELLSILARDTKAPILLKRVQQLKAASK